MDISKVTLMYFSPTGGTARVGRIAAGQFRAPVEEMDLTGPIMPRARDFGPHDLVIAATPCYGGRVPESADAHDGAGHARYTESCVRWARA